MTYTINLKNIQEKNLYPLGEEFAGHNNQEEISFNNYYMEKNGKPFFGISGEFHYSRMSDIRWEDELIKMKMAGLNVVSTYLFWIHHEEEEGVFDFAGRRNLRRFVELCAKHGLYVILRVGPFDHGEVRNGGLPDWLYGKPFQVRTTAPGFLQYTKRLYERIGQETKGLYFKDNGPIIGVQIDNEYMHSSAPWEITTGISNEWIFPGDEGDAYMLKLKELAAESGLCPAFYTCTGWGGAATPESMLPLWGGYSFRPWLFYSYKGEHPATEEYVYQDFHNNNLKCTNDFQPSYQPETRPYACCEMGGGMMCSYYYRFQLPYKSVDAMANIKVGSGCNFLGYYMFQGGSNPVGKYGTYMNEGQVPKISYDYQAALGEFGQLRESYRRLKSMHYFVTSFADRLCGLKTCLPEGASLIDPKDADTLRFAVRTDGKKGFVFVNNYQDHFELPDRQQEEIVLELENETITYQFDIAGDENAVLPFHFDLDGIDIVQATAQPLLRIAPEGKVTYVFMVPNGMQAQFQFEENVFVNGIQTSVYTVGKEGEASILNISKDDIKVRILLITRKLANEMFKVSGDRLVFTDEALLEKEGRLRLETTHAQNVVGIFADDDCIEWKMSCTDSKEVPVNYVQVAPNRYVVEFDKDFMSGVKDIRLQIRYIGDIGHAFINGKMIHDNFYNGAVWEIGLKEYEEELKEHPLTVYITPLKEGVNVNVESGMAARIEEVEKAMGEILSIRMQPVYEVELGGHRYENTRIDGTNRIS